MILTIAEIVLPVFLVTAVGAWIGRRRDIPTTALRHITYTIAGPAVIFSVLLESEIELQSLGLTALVSASMYVLMALVAWGGSTAARWDATKRKGAVLALASMNCANYGLPIMFYAFGDEGLAIGAMFMVTNLLFHMTLGVAVAAWERGEAPRARFVRFLKNPYLYAIILALILRETGVGLPTVLLRPIELVGQIWIPLMLLLLGMQLVKLKVGEIWRPATALSLVKLLVPPALAFGLTELLGIDGVWQAVLVLQSSTPTAVIGLLVAQEFDTRSDLVAATLLVSTLGSVLTMSLLLGLLR